MTGAAAVEMRPLALALLAAWLGAATLAAAVVAPAAFAVLPSRALAGALVGRVLPVIFLAGMAVGLLSAAAAWGDRGDAASSPRIRLVGSLVLAGACAAAQLVVAPRIQQVREAIGPSLEALRADDPRRVAFGRLHAASVAWMGLGMLAAAVAVVALLLALRARRS